MWYNTHIMKKFDISTDDLEGRIEWHRRFDDALKEIICDLHEAESFERWSKSSLMVLDTKVIGADTDGGEVASIINVTFHHISMEYSSFYEWSFKFPSFLLDCTPERYSRYMEWFREEVERKLEEWRKRDAEA